MRHPIQAMISVEQPRDFVEKSFINYRLTGVCLPNDNPNALHFSIYWVYHIWEQRSPFGIKSFSNILQNKHERSWIHNNLHMSLPALGLSCVKHCCCLGSFPKSACMNKLDVRNKVCKMPKSRRHHLQLAADRQPCLRSHL